MFVFTIEKLLAKQLLTYMSGYISIREVHYVIDSQQIQFSDTCEMSFHYQM